MRINIIAPNLSHIPVAFWNARLEKQGVDVHYGYPKSFDDPLLVTDSALFTYDTRYKNVYGWIIESPVILEHYFPGYFQRVMAIQDRFVRIFTHRKALLDSSDVFVFCPHGDCHFVPKELPKTKLVSAIVSEKNFTVGHKLRHEIVNQFRPRFDLYGRGFNPIPEKGEALEPYRFSIAVENCQEDYYFTEKIIECFRTRTIPIYWGCPSIHKFFDVNGILLFSTIDELKRMLDIADEQLYKKMQEHIETNYQKSLAYDTFFSCLKNFSLANCNAFSFLSHPTI